MAVQMTDVDITLEKIKKNAEAVLLIIKTTNSLFKEKEQYILKSRRDDKITYVIYFSSILLCYILNLHYSVIVLLFGILSLDLYLYTRKIKKMNELLYKYFQDLEIKREELIVLANELLRLVKSTKRVTINI